MSIFSNLFTPLLLVLLLLLTVVLFLVVWPRANTASPQRGANRRHSLTLQATITDIHLEATTFISRWIILAQCSWPTSPQPLIFRSPPLSNRPPYQKGGSILVHVNPTRPSDYRMQMEN